MQVSEFKSWLHASALEVAEGRAKEKDIWVQAAMLATETFGPDVFVPGTKAEAKMVEAVDEAFPRPDAPDRSDKSAAANEARAARKLASTLASNAKARMRKYYEAMAGEKTQAPVNKSLEQWATRAIKSLAQVSGNAAAIARIRDALIAAGGKVGNKAVKSAKRPGPVTGASAAKSVTTRSPRKVVKAPLGLSAVANAMVNAPPVPMQKAA